MVPVAVRVLVEVTVADKVPMTVEVAVGVQVAEVLAVGLAV